MDVLFRDIEAAIRDMRISHLSLTPTVAALVNPNNVPNVRFLVTAGEALTQRVFDHWVDRGLYQGWQRGQALTPNIANRTAGYGPSETTNICTVKQVSSCDSINNIGTPLSNTSAFVVYDDEEITLLPRGGVGEFCFGGDQVVSLGTFHIETKPF
jgi:ferricrocin synthase